MKDISIEQYCDGWCVKVDDERFRWDHNDKDLGTESIKALLEYLGHSVKIEMGSTPFFRPCDYDEQGGEQGWAER